MKEVIWRYNTKCMISVEFKVDAGDPHEVSDNAMAKARREIEDKLGWKTDGGYCFYTVLERDDETGRILPPLDERP